MIDWLYQTGLDISILIGLVLVLRSPVRKYLGANVAYWLWAIPLIRLIIWNKAEVPLAILEKIDFSDGTILIKVFKNPEIYNLVNSISYEKIWIAGMIIWLVFRLTGLIIFRKNLKLQSKKLSSTDLNMLKINHDSYHAEYFYTNMPSSPFVTGFLKPEIYLPKDVFDGLSSTHKQCIIEHELTHIKRKDLWMQVLAEVVRMIYWFNPIIHIAWNAFRQDQELACDHQVLANCNKSQRYEYGRVLLKGLHAHALPATMAFFNNHKQRFIMLEKHNNSKINNIFGIVLCTVLLVFALTKAPQSIAKEFGKDSELSFEFNEIPLVDILSLIFNSTQKDVIGYENVPNLLLSLEANNVSANQISNLILKCSGLKLSAKGSQFEIVSINDSEIAYNNTRECRNITIQVQEPVAQKESEV